MERWGTGVGASTEEGLLAAGGWVWGRQAGSRCPDVRGRLKLTVGVKRGLVAKEGQSGGPSRGGGASALRVRGAKGRTRAARLGRAAPAPGVESSHGRASSSNASDRWGGEGRARSRLQRCEAGGGEGGARW